MSVPTRNRHGVRQKRVCGVPGKKLKLCDLGLRGSLQRIYVSTSPKDASFKNVYELTPRVNFKAGSYETYLSNEVIDVISGRVRVLTER